MALNCGIIGLSNTGKTTIFNCISNTKAEIGFATKSNIGMCEVRDERLKLIDNISHSKRIVPATVEIVDLPGLSKGGQGVGNKLLAEVQTVDALIHVLRCFDDPNIPHSEGSIDPVRDMELVDLELQVRDLDLVTRKLQRVEKLLKNGDKDNKRAPEARGQPVPYRAPGQCCPRYAEHWGRRSSAEHESTHQRSELQQEVCYRHLVRPCSDPEGRLFRR